MYITNGVYPAYLLRTRTVPKFDKNSGLMKQRGIIQNQLDKVSMLNLTDEEKAKRTVRLNELLKGVEDKIKENNKSDQHSRLYGSGRDVDERYNAEREFISGLYGNAKLLPFYNKTRMLGTLLNTRDSLINSALTNDMLQPKSLIDRKVNSLTGSMIKQANDLSSLVGDIDFTSDYKEELKAVRDALAEKESKVEKKDSKPAEDVSVKDNEKKDSADKTGEYAKTNKYLESKLSTYNYLSVSNVEKMLNNNYKMPWENRIMDFAL